MVRGATIDAAHTRGADSGDLDAELFGRLYPSLRRFAAAAGPSDMDPDDLVQEAVARAIRLRPLAELEDPGAYLRRAILNLAKNRRRSLARARQARRRLALEAQHDPVYASDLADLERVGVVARALLFLVEVEGWTYAAAARQLDLSEEAARARASRARRQLRMEMEEDL